MEWLGWGMGPLTRLPRLSESDGGQATINGRYQNEQGP